MSNSSQASVGMSSDNTKPGLFSRPGWIFFLLFILYFFDYSDRMVVVSLFQHLKEEWGLNDKQLGLLISSVYWSLILGSFPISIFIDRWSRKNSIGVMAIVWCFATGICAFVGTYPQLLVARAAIGLGEAGYAPGGTAMISALFSEKRRALMIGIWNMAIPLGSAFGVVLGGYIATHYGWRHAFGVVAVPGLIAAILFFFVKDYKTIAIVPDSDAKPLLERAKEVARGVMKTKSLLLTYLGFAANQFVIGALLSWLPAFFERVHSLPTDKAGQRAGAIMLLAIIGAPLGGILSDLWTRKNKKGRLYFAALASAATGILFAAGFHSVGVMQTILLFCGGAVAAAYASPAAAVTQDVVHPGIRAISYSLAVIVMNLLGASLGPLVTGAISDSTNILTALQIVPLVTLLGTVLFLFASIFYQKDREVVEKLSLNQ